MNHIASKTPPLRKFEKDSELPAEALSPQCLPQLGVPDEARRHAAADLQSLLSDLLMAAAQTKQAHWNLRGMQFQSVHEHLDAVHTSLRSHADEVAERISTLGEVADGRIRTTQQASSLDTMPDRLIAVRETLQMVAASLTGIANNGRGRLSSLAEQDPISEDLVIGVVSSVEKHEWMLRYHLTP